MADKSAIEWTDATWNPVTGCDKISAGCKNCYAEQLHTMRYKAHLAGKKIAPTYHTPFTDVQLHSERLDQPLRWRKPRRIFVNSMSDLFHESVPDEFIEEVFAVMAVCPQHTFQVLTKRPERMAQWFAASRSMFVAGAAQQAGYRHLLPNIPMNEWWPLPNVWLGVSVENQEQADARIPHLLQTPAAVRFLSCEPLLAEVDVRDYLPNKTQWCPTHGGPPSYPVCDCGKVDWLICGGESGRLARDMHPMWARDLRDQCKSAGVPFFMKQMADKAPIPVDLMVRESPKPASPPQEAEHGVGDGEADA